MPAAYDAEAKLPVKARCLAMSLVLRGNPARRSEQAILIEDRASGTQLIQEPIAAGCSRATRFAPEGDKVMRLFAQTATIENGFVWLPEEAPWLADYLAELLAFPAGRYDDQVDSTAQALAWVKQRPAGAAGWIEFIGRGWRRRDDTVSG